MELGLLWAFRCLFFQMLRISLRFRVDQSFVLSMVWTKIPPVIQAASEALAAKQEVTRVRNGTNVAVRNLNEQVGRYVNIVAFRSSIGLVGV